MAVTCPASPWLPHGFLLLLHWHNGAWFWGHLDTPRLCLPLSHMYSFKQLQTNSFKPSAKSKSAGNHRKFSFSRFETLSKTHHHGLEGSRLMLCIMHYIIILACSAAFWSKSKARVSKHQFIELTLQACEFSQISKVSSTPKFARIGSEWFPKNQMPVSKTIHWLINQGVSADCLCDTMQKMSEIQMIDYFKTTHF